MGKVDTSLIAQHAIATGDTGSGKSTWLKRLLTREKRVLVWDPDDEWGEENRFERIVDRVQLIDKLKRRKQGRFAFVSNDMEHFDWWCRAAWAWGNCTAVAEEIADVTTPGKAPPGWGTLVRRGRKHAIQVMATTQRPQESDKTVWTQARYYFVGQLPDTDSATYVARRLSLELDQLRELGPLDYLLVDKRERQVEKARLTF